MAHRSKRLIPIAVAGALLMLGGVVTLIAGRSRKAEPTQLAAQVMSPGTLVVAEQLVFFSAFVGEGKSLRAIFSIPATGGTPKRLAASPMELPSLAVDADYAYYPVYAEDKLMRVPIGGGAATALCEGQRHPLAVVRGADALYFSARVLGGRAIFKLGLGGGTPVAVHSGLGELVAMVADRDAVYAATGDKVVHVAGTGAVTTLAPGAGRITALAAQGDAVLVATSAPPAVLRVPLGGGAAIRLFALKTPAIALAADATRVYVATGDREATLLAGAITGGEPSLLASDPERPSSIAVDRDYVYWASGERNGKVLRVRKP